jgi:hypothetical protein
VELIDPRGLHGDEMVEVPGEARTVHSCRPFHRVFGSLEVGQEEVHMILMPPLASCSNQAEVLGGGIVVLLHDELAVSVEIQDEC